MKKKISLFLSLAMLVSSFVSLHVQAAQVSFADVTVETKYQPAILTLAKMGLINGYEEEGVNNFKPENNITRAEFTAIITRAMGVGDIDSGVTVFPDVQDHWARGNIQVAFDRKIVNGFEDGTFKPNENVTYEQAVKMIVCTLGYETAAQMFGGWPDGYITQGNKLGVTSGISGVIQKEPATRAVVAQLIYNALEAEVLDVTTGEDNDVEETFMEKYLKMKKEKVTIIGVADEVTAELGNEKLGVNQIAVKLVKDATIKYLDFTQYTQNKADLSKYLGQTVMIYYQYDVVGSDDILIDMGTEVTKNTVTEIRSDDLVSYTPGKITYYNDKDKKLTIKIDEANLSLIYNGVLVDSSLASSKLTGWCQEGGADQIYGTVKVTDSGSTGAGNLVEIMDYEVLVAAKAPSSSDYKITNKYKLKGETDDKSIILDPKGDIDYTIKYQNSEIETTSIRTNDVVLVALSENKEKCDVLVSREVIKGKITAYFESEEEVTINNKKYILHDKLLKYADDEGFRSAIKVGAEVEFYADAFGNIVYGSVKSSQAVAPYAYIFYAGPTDDGDNYFVRMYSPSKNKIETYNLKDNVRFNGASISASAVEGELRLTKETPPDEVIGSDGKSNVTTGDFAQVARVEVNNNLITAITTVNVAIDTKIDDSSALSQYSNYKYLEFKSGNSFGDFYINSNTTVIRVPKDRTDGTGYSNSKFSKDSKYYVVAYNVNQSKQADLVLVYPASNTKGTEVVVGTLMSVVAKKGTTEYADDEALYKLPYYNSSSSLTEKLVGSEESSDYEALQPGDIFRTGTDKDGNLGNLQGSKAIIALSDIVAEFNAANSGTEPSTIFDWTNSKFQFTQSLSNNNKSAHDSCTELYMYNVLELDVDSNLIRVTSDGFVKGEDGTYTLSDSNEYRFDIPDNCVILRYDAKDKEVSPYVKDTETVMTLADINGGADILGTSCSKIAIYEYAGTVKMIVVYDELAN